MSDRDNQDRIDADETTTHTTGDTADYGPTDRGGPTGSHRNPSERGKWISTLIAVLGLGLLAAAFVLDVAAANFWNDLIVGVAFVALGGYNYYRRSDERFGSVGVGAFVAVLGIWLLATPFVLDPAGASAMDAVPFWTDVIVGLLALGLGVYSAYEASRDVGATAPART